MLKYILSVLLISVAVTVCQAQERSVDPSNVLGRVLRIKPTAGMMRWQRIPWARALQDAIHQAKDEKRPIFLWASDDEPLDRC